MKTAVPIICILVLLSVLLGLPDHFTVDGIDKCVRFLNGNASGEALDETTSLTVMLRGVQAVAEMWSPRYSISIIHGRPPESANLHGSERVTGTWYCVAVPVPNSDNPSIVTDAYLLAENVNDFPADWKKTHWALKCLSSFSHGYVSSDGLTDALLYPVTLLTNYAKAAFGYASIGGWYLLGGLEEILRIVRCAVYLVGLTSSP